ncbi:hypothetical protein E3Q18_01099 [Wallemia mellicola]|uniref:VWFA domain-containing protein n=1 Tax=Wallemia mellicola TaxID=1708541 RepID=A0A4T0TBF8_9BASI|nr:hypothetical protein E3Q23_03274 [Wallemia mellicola]TIC00677.1 hypothetical protein E3Q18_01099 [Wallemia mellicola]TIC62462.1 hypothetical protein E3Q01_03928 [Wallemia mellicola]
MVELPHDPRKTREVVLVFAEGADAKAAKEAGADIVGGEELVGDLLSGKQALPTKALAHPSLLPQVQKNLARMLGPKGLMPAEKRGTVTTELAKAINEARGKVTWRGDRIGVVRLGVGRIQFDSNQVEENIKKFIDGLRNGMIIDTAPGQPRRCRFYYPYFPIYASSNCSLINTIMVLEASFVLIDNSEYMRNGDILPNRFQAQVDGVGLLAQAKMNMNPENTVGLMTIAGSSPEVLVTSTADDAKIIASMHDVKISGELDFIHGLQVAQLALKHRQNKVQRQRIVAFIGSPISEDSKELEKLGKKLKKNNVAVDLVVFGEIDENQEKLEKFIHTLGGTDNNRILIVPPENRTILSDYLINSPIVRGTVDPEESGPSNPAPSGFEFGVDPSLDPELAMALRMSMEEEQARQTAGDQGAEQSTQMEDIKEEKEKDEKGTQAEKDVEMSTTDQPQSKQEEDTTIVDADDADDEEAEIQKAIAMSMQNDNQEQK